MISVFAILLMAFSCNSDDNSDEIIVEENGFFSKDVLKVGNKWVYKTYDNRNTIVNPADYEFNGKEIHTEIIGKTTANGIDFFQIEHKNYRNGNLENSYTGFVRINSKGHYVHIGNETINQGNVNENSGYVYHPGQDFTYTRTENFEGAGILEYKLYDNENINIEGVNYEVAPFRGYFTPTGSSEPLLSKTVVYSFNKNIGFVKLVCHSVHGTYTWEDRLVSFTPGN